MATHIAFVNGQETSVTENESEVVQAIRREHPNPVKLAGLDGVVMYVNSSQITSIGPRPEPRWHDLTPSAAA
jgi:uncharacterized protein YlzI (FlbEa/FlbD family)